MESSSTASLQQQMHTISNLSSAAGSSNLNSCSSLADEPLIRCPTCDKKLHRFEVASHCEQEMQRLKELQTQQLTESHDLKEDEQAVEERSTVSNGQSTSAKRKPWTVFQRVQRNRQSRLKQRTRKRPAAPEHPCPVCNLQFPQDEIQQHAEACLRRSNRTANGRSNSDEHSSNDDEDGGGGEEYEEYEWAGQKRIRVSSLLQGGYAAIGIGQPLTNGGSSSSSRHNGHQIEDDDDEDLNVDEDDTQIYGPEQYGENDVIPSHILNEDESDVTSYMRRLITGSSTSSSSQLSSNLAINNENLNINSSLNSHNDVPVESSSSIECSNSSSYTVGDPSTPAQYQQIIDSLKAKLHHYELQHVPGKYKCLICLDDYRNPAISVACWHVHCEQCWLRSLGARKLCPQCNLITTPKDLRRIYM